MSKLKTSCLALAFASVGVTSSAFAQVSEPNGLSVPQPILAEEATRENFPGSLSLKGLFDTRGETIDPVADAKTSPASFSPLCSFSGTLVLRGGGCKVDFGWYNVTGKVPTDAELYTLVPNTDPIFTMGTGDFNPQAGQQSATFTADAIKADPRYLGGQIGFAIRGNPAEPCKQTKYSQPELNMTCTNCTPPSPWITALIYQSTATPDAFYVCFEDLPHSPTDFTDPSSTWKNDGDFNDFCYFVTGLSCKGGGLPCEVPGAQGACKSGLTDCDGNCRQQVQPTQEKCDNVDNDCNGLIDDGDLCDVNYVCDRGECVKACGTGEFVCNAPLVCARGFCVDPLCEHVDCPPDKACRSGECVGLCDGVVCPMEQVCQFGQCVDLCEGQTCKEGTVCDSGICIGTCECHACATGQVCVASGPSAGHCVDSGCETQTCPVGSLCIGGSCVDTCQGAICPDNGLCVAGKCMPGTGSGGAGGVGTGGTAGDGSGGSIIIDPDDAGVTGGTGGTNNGSGGDDGLGGDGGGRRSGAAGGCACRLDDTSRRADGLAALGLLALTAVSRARSRRRAV